ncbi:hypothetical protein CCR75_003740 [Bremia lactucae]|uniref:Uncharacterized protein n=1 Tax=Bremia lactucae TaxID=4779 RepID=A0A976IEI5_BRELC|nr:hypothetical protein CCR75_003740 [Bremia lactucae]
MTLEAAFDAVALDQRQCYLVVDVKSFTAGLSIAKGGLCRMTFLRRLVLDHIWFCCERLLKKG